MSFFTFFNLFFPFGIQAQPSCINKTETLRLTTRLCSNKIVNSSLTLVQHHMTDKEGNQNILLNSQPHRVPTVKVKTLAGKQWDPVCWGVDMWRDPIGAGDTKPLNSDESSLSMKVSSPPQGVLAFPPPSEGINLHCLRKQSQP